MRSRQAVHHLSMEELLGTEKFRLWSARARKGYDRKGSYACPYCNYKGHGRRKAEHLSLCVNNPGRAWGVAEVKDTFGAIVRMFVPSHTGRITSSNVDGLITEVRASKGVQYPLVRKILEKAGSDWQKRKKLSTARAIRRLRKKARTDHEKAIVHFVKTPAELLAYYCRNGTDKKKDGEIDGGIGQRGRNTSQSQSGSKRLMKILCAFAKAELNSQCYLEKGVVFKPVIIWNNAREPPGPQQLHSDGASSVSVALAKPGRNLDLLTVHGNKFVRIQILIPYGKALFFNPCTFHAGAPGTLGQKHPSLHFNVGPAADNETFQQRFLHRFEHKEARKYLPRGMVKMSGHLDFDSVKTNCPKTEAFKNYMVGYYPTCSEWDGDEITSNHEFRKCSYSDFVDDFKEVIKKDLKNMI